MKPLGFCLILSLAAIFGGEWIGNLTAIESVPPALSAALACAITGILLVLLAAILVIRLLYGHWPNVVGASRDKVKAETPKL